ncbi:GXGXG motif family protein [Desulfovibrionales bacterium]
MTKERKKLTIDARGVYYRDLNVRIREALAEGVTDVELLNVNGQRYIANSADGDLIFTIYGVPGQDLAVFMRTSVIYVYGNAQDGVANTMDDGRVIIHGLAGDVLGYGMRGGKLFVKGDVGYRVGIHMKAYMDKLPVIIIGGKSGDFLGEYMAGGAIILLGMLTGKPNAPITGRSLGTGMHGGVIYVRGTVPDYQLGLGLHTETLDEKDLAFLYEQVTDFAQEFGIILEEILAEPFVKIKPFSHRPYGNMYVGTN